MSLNLDFDGNMTLPVDFQIGPSEEHDNTIVFQLRRRTPTVKMYCEVSLEKIDGLAEASYEGIAKKNFLEFLQTIQQY